MDLRTKIFGPRTKISLEEKKDLRDNFLTMLRNKETIPEETFVEDLGYHLNVIRAANQYAKRVIAEEERQKREQEESTDFKSVRSLGRTMREFNELQTMMQSFAPQASEQGPADIIDSVSNFLNTPVGQSILAKIAPNVGASLPGAQIAPQTQSLTMITHNKEDTIFQDIAGLKTAPKDYLKPDIILNILRSQPIENKTRIKQTYETIDDLRKLTVGIGITLKEKEEQKIMEGIRSL